LEAFGVKVAAREKPRAERIFEKVKKQIEGQYLSVGIFTKSDKISAKEEWAGVVGSETHSRESTPSQECGTILRRTSRTTEVLIRKPPGMVALRRCPRTGGQNVRVSSSCFGRA
jgi:hypothetical protein